MSEIARRYTGNYYIVIEDEGIFRQGQRCYIFSEQGAYVWAVFEKPVIGTISEVKVPVEKINDARVFQKL